MITGCRRRFVRFVAWKIQSWHLSSGKGGLQSATFLGSMSSSERSLSGLLLDRRRTRQRIGFCGPAYHVGHHRVSSPMAARTTASEWIISSPSLHAGRSAIYVPASGVLTISWRATTSPRRLVDLAWAVLQAESIDSFDSDEIMFSMRSVGRSWDSMVQLCRDHLVDASAGLLWRVAGPGDALGGWLSTRIETPSSTLFASATDEFDDQESSISGDPTVLHRVMADDKVRAWALGLDATSSELDWLREIDGRNAKSDVRELGRGHRRESGIAPAILDLDVDEKIPSPRGHG